MSWDNTACPGLTQDRDNVAGGTNGPETVTLTDSLVNVEYSFIIAIDDWELLSEQVGTVK